MWFCTLIIYPTTLFPNRQNLNPKYLFWVPVELHWWRCTISSPDLCTHGNCLLLPCSCRPPSCPWLVSPTFRWCRSRESCEWWHLPAKRGNGGEERNQPPPGESRRHFAPVKTFRGCPFVYFFQWIYSFLYIITYPRPFCSCVIVAVYSFILNQRPLLFLLSACLYSIRIFPLVVLVYIHLHFLINSIPSFVCDQTSLK